VNRSTAFTAGAKSVSFVSRESSVVQNRAQGSVSERRCGEQIGQRCSRLLCRPRVGVPAEVGGEVGVPATATVDAWGSTVSRGEAGASTTGGGEVGVSIATVAGDNAKDAAGSVSLGTIETKAASADSAATMRAAPMLSRRTPRRGTLCRCCWPGEAPCHNQSPETSSSGTALRAGGSVMLSDWPRCRGAR